jgi:3-oxoacyl-[acyl-carrier-protein] synthase-1/3-oxoacyl-[acyl-carrier-protein] synthase II
MKRLARIALGLAVRTMAKADVKDQVGDVFFGTALGALSETHSFLNKLYASNEFYTSPIDFVGSVHNAPAGKVAMKENIQGANVTMSGGDASFEQALTAARYLTTESQQPFLVGGADEMHPIFSEVFDSSVTMGDTPSDGGGMLLLKAAADGPSLILSPGYLAASGDVTASLQAAAAYHGGRRALNDRVGALMVGLPAAWRETATPLLDDFKRWLGFAGPVIDYRRYFGEFASASAVAAVAALAPVERGTIPGALVGGSDYPLAGRGILLIGLGTSTATMLAEFS